MPVPERSTGAASPQKKSAPTRLIDKAELLTILPVTFPTVWNWMRKGKFPRGYVLNGKTVWDSAEVNDFLAGMKRRAYKGDEEGSR